MLRTILSSLWSRKRRLLSTVTAVFLGVAFLAATMVLGDTTKAGFTDAFSTANAGTDVVVRNATRIGGAEERVTGVVDEAVLDQLATVDGVAAVAPEVSGIGQLLGADGEPVGGEGPPTLAGNWIDDPDLGSLRLVEGRAPQPVADPDAPLEVVIDRDSAEDGTLGVGATTSVLAPTPVPVVVVGISEFATGEPLGGTTFTSFELDAAQRLFTGDEDALSSILVHAADGVTSDDLRARLAAALPDDLEAITGAELTAEQEDDIDAAFLGMFKTMLLAFAGISIVVAAFSIHNTFTILVAQRTRESALLRAIGASRRQVVTGVAVEALVVGLLATALGFGAGIGIATALRSMMESSLDLPHADLVVGSGAVVASIVVGVGTTLLASLAPAIRASRVPPLAALRDVAIDRSGSSKVRAVIGVVLVAAGAAWLVSAPSAGTDALGRGGLGALVLVVGAVVLGPVVARPAAAVLGVVPAVSRGITGRLARRNAMRNPRRTAASASALMVGTAVVALFTTFGASIKASINEAVDENFSGDLVVIPDGFSGALLSPELPDAIAEVPDVTAAVGAAYSPVLVGDDTVELVGTDVGDMNAIFDVGVTAGGFDGFGPTDLGISERYADDHDLALGDTVTMSWADGATTPLTVSAIFEDRMTFGDLITTTDAVTAHVPQASFTVVLVDLADGVDPDAGQAAVAAVTERFGAPAPMNESEYKDRIGEEVDGMLFFVYAMLGVAVLIALLGIGNTLSLSIFDRTRELGLLRAVGQERSQMRSSVRWESVIIAVFGTLGGVALGAFCGWGLMRAMEEAEGFGTFALPVGPLAVVIGLAAAAGLLAAVRPARRAARIDILTAIASD